MKETPQMISTFSICFDAYQTFTAIKGKLLKLTVFTIFLPLFFSEILLSKLSETPLFKIQELAEQSQLGGILPNYMTYLEIASEYFTPFLFCALILLIFIFSSFMGLTQIALKHLKGEALPEASSAFFWGLKQFLGKGIPFLVLLLFFSLEKFFWGPFRILSMFLLMAPVIYTAERNSMLRAIHKAIFLKYSNPKVSTAFNTAFTLIVFGALLFFGESLIAFLGRTFLELDHWVPVSKNIWSTNFLTFSFSPVYFFTHGVLSLLYSFLVMSIPLFAVHLYFRFGK